MSGSSKDSASEYIEDSDTVAIAHLRDSELEKKHAHGDSEELPDTQPLSPYLSLGLSHKPTSSQESNVSNSQNESLITRDGSRNCSDSSFNKSKSIIESHTSSNFESPIITSASVLASTPRVSQRMEIRQQSSHKRKLESSDHTPSKRQNLSVEIVYDSMTKKHENISQEIIVISDSDKSFIQVSDGSEKFVYSDDSRLFNKPALPASADSSLETSTKGIRDKPDFKPGGHIKQYHERLNSMITFTVDEKKHEIISVSISQINMCEESVSTVSSSSDAGSVCSTGLLPLPTSRLSTLSVTSTSSSSTSGSASVVARNIAPVGNFQILSKLSNYKLRANCVCTCYCSTMFNNQTRKLSNISPCSHEIVINSSKETSKSKVGTDEETDIIVDDESVETANEKEDIKTESPMVLKTEPDQPTEKLPLCEDIALSESRGGLLVFARWPGSTYFYPGIVEGVNGKYWQENFYLKVKFCDYDNQAKKIASTNIFPAHFIKPDATVLHKDENNEFCSFTVISVDRTHVLKKRKRKIPLSYKIRNEEVVKNVAFEKIIVPNLTYKQLKNKILLSLTPRAKGQISSKISHENIQEGKRQRLSVNAPATNTPSSRIPYKSKTSAVKKLPGSGSPPFVSSSLDTKEIHSSAKTDLKSGDQPMICRGEFSGTTKVCSADRQKCSGTSEEYSSEQDAKALGWRYNLNEMCGEGLDVEYFQPSAKKTVGSRKPKSSSGILTLVAEDESLIKTLGPIPNVPIFEGFNFILTHTEERQPIPIVKHSSSEGTDFEDYYDTDVPFDAMRLKSQIIAGGGIVYQFVTDIPTDELSKTIVISDVACRTPNYLFAVVNRIAIFRHDLIVHCCIENKPIAQLMNTAMRLPTGRSRENGDWIVDTKKQPLDGYLCILAVGENINSLLLWQRLLEDAGAKVITLKNQIRDLGGLPISFVLANEDSPKELLLTCKENGIPVVSFIWLIETILHGKPRQEDSLPEYRVNFPLDS